VLIGAVDSYFEGDCQRKDRLPTRSSAQPFESMSATRPTSEGTAPSSVALPFCKPNNNNNNNNNNNKQRCCLQEGRKEWFDFSGFWGCFIFFTIFQRCNTLSNAFGSLAFIVLSCPLPCNTSFSLLLLLSLWCVALISAIYQTLSACDWHQRSRNGSHCSVGAIVSGSESRLH
jgi:hypothetical protein